MLESHAALKASAVSPARVVQGSAVRLAAMYWAWGKTDEAKVWEAGK